MHIVCSSLYFWPFRQFRCLYRHREYWIVHRIWHHKATTPLPIALCICYSHHSDSVCKVDLKLELELELELRVANLSFRFRFQFQSERKKLQHFGTQLNLTFHFLFPIPVLTTGELCISHIVTYPDCWRYQRHVLQWPFWHYSRLVPVLASLGDSCKSLVLIAYCHWG